MSKVGEKEVSPIIELAIKRPELYSKNVLKNKDHFDTAMEAHEGPTLRKHGKSASYGLDVPNFKVGHLKGSEEFVSGNREVKFQDEQDPEALLARLVKTVNREVTSLKDDMVLEKTTDHKITLMRNKFSDVQIIRDEPNDVANTFSHSGLGLNGFEKIIGNQVMVPPKPLDAQKVQEVVRLIVNQIPKMEGEKDIKIVLQTDQYKGVEIQLNRTSSELGVLIKGGTSEVLHSLNLAKNDLQFSLESKLHGVIAKVDVDLGAQSDGRSKGEYVPQDDEEIHG